MRISFYVLRTFILLTRVYIFKKPWRLNLLPILPSYIHSQLHQKVDFNAGGPAYYVLHPQKGITIRIFFLTYQAFIKWEGSISRKILTQGLQI